MTTQDLYLLSPELALVGLAALLVLVDLVLPRRGLLTGLATVGLAVPLALALVLWFDVASEGARAGIFGTLMVDRFSLFFKFLVLAVVALVFLTSTEYARRFQRFLGEYYALVLLSATGMFLLASAVELINIYIALELTALPVVALAAFLRDDRSSESGLKFLVLSAVSSAVLLYGMVYVYGMTGSTMLSEIAGRVSALAGVDGPFGGRALLLGLVLIVAGFGFKIASVPFQMWVPDVYEGSPTPVTAFLAVASKAAGFAVILRVFYMAFPQETLSLQWGSLFAGLSVASMTVGNLVAIAQSNIKRLLAYSTIAHAGYLLVGLAAVAARQPAGEGVLGPSGVLFYLGGYVATNIAAFAAVIAISNKTGSDQIDAFAGMGRRAPFAAAVLAFAMVSLIGVPPTVGFMAKVYIFGAAVEAGMAWLALVGVLNSVVSAYYYLRVVKVMYLSPAASPEPVRSDLAMRVALLATLAGTVFFGVYPTPLLQLARRAADVLLS